jgi:acetylornithine deacetylase
MPRDVFERIEAAVDADRILDFFKSVIAIASPRFGETALARHVGTFLSGMGATVEYQRVVKGDRSTEQVIGRWGRDHGGKKIVLSAHLDAGSGQYQGLVFQSEKWTKDPFKAVVEDGYIYGLGTHNNKQGITSSVMALDALIKSGVTIEGQVIVACVASETIGCIGASELIKNGLDADVAVVTEGTGLDVVNTSVAKVRGRIFVAGEHAHHSVHVSPVENLRHLLEAFAPGYGENFVKSFLTHAPDPALPLAPNAAIRWVMSDLKDLDQCMAFFDVVCVPGMTEPSVQADLERMLRSVGDRHPDFVAHVDMAGWEPPMSGNFGLGALPTPADSDVVRCVAAHHTAVRGEPPTVGAGRRYGAASDAGPYREAGIRTVEYGPGSIGPDGDVPTWPAVDERVRVRDVIDCVRVLARAACDLANQPRG